MFQIGGPVCLETHMGRHPKLRWWTKEYKIASTLVRKVYEKAMAEIHGQRSRSTMSRPCLSVFVMPERLSMTDTFGSWLPDAAALINPESSPAKSPRDGSRIRKNTCFLCKFSFFWNLKSCCPVSSWCVMPMWAWYSILWSKNNNINIKDDESFQCQKCTKIKNCVSKLWHWHCRLRGESLFGTVHSWVRGTFWESVFITVSAIWRALIQSVEVQPAPAMFRTFCAQ